MSPAGFSARAACSFARLNIFCFFLINYLHLIDFCCITLKKILNTNGAVVHATPALSFSKFFVSKIVCVLDAADAEHFEYHIKKTLKIKVSKKINDGHLRFSCIYFL